VKNYLLLLLVHAFFLLIFSLLFAKSGMALETRDLVEYVDPFIGVRDEGCNTTIGPQLPFGSINPGPDTKDGGPDGYHPARPIRGFSQNHVSGTGGGGKYGHILISPQIGLAIDKEGHDSEKAEEIAMAHYYSVRLTRYDIRVELTPTEHAAIYRFTFPQSEEAHILFDLGHNIPGDIAGVWTGGYLEAGEVKIDSKNNRITGWGQYYGGWQAEAYRVFFVAESSKAANAHGIWKDRKVQAGGDAVAVAAPKERTGAYFQYTTGEEEVIYLKIAVSFRSLEQAEKHLRKEIPGWDFAAVAAAARAKWNEYLSTILIDDPTATREQLTIFYTALYHTAIMPRDRTGDCPWTDYAGPYWDDHYTIWDTFRTLFPFYALVKPSILRDNINSFITRFHRNGKVMDAFIAGRDGGSPQGGDAVDTVIADAYLKGIPGVDWYEAYAILKDAAENKRLPAYREHDRGWIPDDLVEGWPKASVSKTLEFAYNDFTTALVAQGLGFMEDYERYLQRSRQWENLWSSRTKSNRPGSRSFSGFIRPRRSNMAWVSYDPDKWYTWDGPFFYEGSAWTYSYYVPHDVSWLIELMGGPERFVARTEYAFDHNLIDLGNEPSFLVARLFNYALRPDLTSYYVRKAMAHWTLDGYPGNEDSGAMSSWYIFSALGFFPVAGQDLYLINGPLFKKCTIQLENGKQLIVEAIDASGENIYVAALTLNGEEYDKNWLRHSAIKDGGHLVFQMSAGPTAWGRAEPVPAMPEGFAD
jgi:predicted alpha-1,2-mannosidase